MKVKVGNEVFDGGREPVMVILTPEDKKNIAAMPPFAIKYCAYPEERFKVEDIRRWMSETNGWGSETERCCEEPKEKEE